MTSDDVEHDDVTSVREYLQHLVSADHLSGAPMPSADFIWWRAQLAQKRKLAQRSVLAIKLMSYAATVLAAAFALLITVLWAPRLVEVLHVPLSLTVAAVGLFVCSSGIVLFAWGRQRF